MLNVEKSRPDKVITNEKLLPVVTALGAGFNEDFDVEKLRYHKVVIMADADVDGAHIRTLLLTFFFRYMRPLIDGGYVYIAQPPLYKLSKGKKHEYAYECNAQQRAEDELEAEGLADAFTVARTEELGAEDAGARDAAEHTEVKYEYQLVGDGNARHRLGSQLTDHNIIKQVDKVGDAILDHHWDGDGKYHAVKGLIADKSAEYFFDRSHNKTSFLY